MILDATLLSHFQSCRRRSLLESTHHPPRLRAKTLFESHLRRGIELLSSGTDLTQLIPDARARFLGQCANPGLDLPRGANPFIVAKDWAMALEMILRSAARLSLLTLNPVASVSLGDGFSWKVSSLADDSSTLHRWIACDRWDEDELSRQAHGWWAFGDMAATGRSLQLHVIEVGQIRNGRRESCWTRGYRHRLAPNLPLSFRRPQSRDDVVVEHLADLRRDPEPWVDALFKEGLVEKHIRHVTLECPPEEICEDTVRQMVDIGREIESLRDSGSIWSAIPMSRSSCDGMVPCPWQDCCYSWPQREPEELGYVRISEASPTVRLVGAVVEMAGATGRDGSR